MDESQGRRDIVGVIRKLVELAMPNLRHYYRMTRKARVAAVYESSGEYFCDVQPLRNDESVDALEPVVPRVSLPVLWGGPDRGIVCPPVAGTLCDLSYYDGDPNYPYISNIRWGGGMNAPKAALNELVIQLEDGVEIRIDKEKRIVTLTPQDVQTKAGKGWTVKTGDNATIRAGKETLLQAGSIASIVAPRINLQGHVVCTSFDGTGKGQAEFEGDMVIRGNQTVTGDTTTGGNAHVSGNAYAGSRSGGSCPH